MVTIVTNNRPCVDTYKICKCVNEALKIYANERTMLKNKIKMYVFSRIDLKKIYPLSIVENHNGDPAKHIEFIVDFFITSFIHKVQTKSAKTKALSLHENFIRQNNRRNVNMSGQ